MPSTNGSDARSKISAQLRARLEARLATLRALAAAEDHQRRLRQFTAAKPTIEQVRGRSDLNHQQIDRLIAQPYTRAASKAVDRYLDVAERMEAFAARLAHLEVIG